MSDSRISFVEEVDVTVGDGLGSGQMMRMVTSTDYLHVHPLRMQPRDGTEAYEIFCSLPLEEAGPRLGKLGRSEMSAEASGSANLYPLNGSGQVWAWTS